jgi:hypothetical protein
VYISSIVRWIMQTMTKSSTSISSSTQLPSNPAENHERLTGLSSFSTFTT